MSRFRSALFAALLALPAITVGGACGPRHASYVGIDGAVLGRVVIYRNGVAFYERRATITDGQLAVRVPRDRVDDFLKSLTVVDPDTRRPLAVTIPRKQADDGNYLTMTIETADAGAPGRHARTSEVLLTYVTEAPAWKPSYRVVVGDGGKVMLEGWAIVDNTSGEDWKGVLIGVGASSALSFRYDLWSVRSIDRDLLAGEDKFAIAPPTGVSPYAQAADGVAVANLEPDEVRAAVPTIDATSTTAGIMLDKNELKNIPAPGKTFESALGAAAGSQGDGLGTSFSGSTSLENQYYVDGVNTTGLTYGTVGQPQSSYTPPPAPPPPPPVTKGDAKLLAIVGSLMKDHRDVLIQPHGPPGSEAAARARGEAVKVKLIDDGIPAARIHIAPKIAANETAGVRVLAFAPGATPAQAAAGAAARGPMPDSPVGESHFIADRPMTVKAGTSAMVAMVHGETTGGVVYLYDPLSDRGDQRFAFKAVKLDNPTTDTLEPGPVTVYGNGRFIGEGITEPVPPKASVVVPFALDRQIVIERNGHDDDRITRLETVQRGVLTAEIQHRRTTTFTVTSRLAEPTTVYLRHRLEPGWSLIDAPSTFTKVGDSQLFAVALAAGETKDVAITEATPVERSLQLSSDEALGMMKVYIDAPDATPALRLQIAALMATHRDAADLVDKIATLHDQLGEYRERADELHAQLVTLKLVKTGGDLMSALRGKLVETSERIQKATIAVVDTQEQLMLARVKFQNQLADLKLEPAATASAASPVASRP